METFLAILPLIAVVLLLALRQHMLVAGAVGGILAMVIGKMSPAAATPIFLDAIHNSVGAEVSIIYSALGGMLYQSGSFQSGIDLARRHMNERHHVPAVMVLILLHGCLTYMIGLGVVSTYLIAPIIFSLVGFVPRVVAALSIVSAVGFCTSPASPETLITSQIAGRNVVEYAASMLPYTFFFYGLAALLAGYGVWKQGIAPKAENEETAAADTTTSYFALLVRSLPSIVFLVLLISANPINKQVGANVVTPLTILVLIAVLTILCTKFSTDEMSVSLVENSRFVLMVLFAVGIFLGFLNIISELGAFQQLVSLAGYFPLRICLPVAMLLAFLIAIPAGAFCTAIILLVLPTLAGLGLWPESLGLVAIAAGLGAHVSPVQVNVGAFRDCFHEEQATIIRANVKFMLGALAVLIAVAMLVWKL